MEDSLKFHTCFGPNHVLVSVDVPALDLEHESSLELDVFPNECVFTAPPYHARIPIVQVAKSGKVYPDKIDYEKNVVTFRVELESGANEKHSSSNSFGYGFGRFYNGPLSLEAELKALPNPGQHSPTDRMDKLQQAEKNDFNDEHYGMDYIQFLIDKLGINLSSPPMFKALSEEQRYRIGVIVTEKQKPKDRFTSIEDPRLVLLGLLDILIAITYDRLTNNNELNEANSHTNIHRISATLSFFVEFDTAEAVVRSFYRRSCIYPLYRNKQISQLCVKHLIDCGKAADRRKEWIQHELLHAYDAFKTTDWSIMNHYYTKDYIRYVEHTFDDLLWEQTISEMEKILPDVHNSTLGFGEENVIQRFLKELITQDTDSDSTDSDDYESATEDSGKSSLSSSDATASEEKLPNENVLEKLMNLKLSG
ncbi:protein SHQ1 homolog [Anopheles bellator]|uniref:protein SHQ1 homolog n=1 Tax=Anopheles bellator TaxID=139047 RepID=UPI002648EF25|nr:protein SHQ1 homolog [Anopheles bellator]